MRTVKLNIREEQRKWIELHAKADVIQADKNGVVVEAIYFSPMKKWEGLIDPEGYVNAPDMDYYNKANLWQGEIGWVIHDLGKSKPVAPKTHSASSGQATKRGGTK